MTAERTSSIREEWASLAGRGLAIALTVLMVAVILAPIGTVLLSSFWSAPFLQMAGHFTLSNYHSIVVSPRSAELLRNTFVYTAGSAVIAVVLGTTLAWIVTRTRVPFPKIARLLPVFPLFLPALLKDTSWIQLFSPKTGLVNLGINALFGLEQSVIDVFSMGGMIANAGLALAPITYLMLLSPLGSMDRSLEEASLSSGAGHWRTVRLVTLPAVRPALISAFALTSIIVACSFETPIVIGLPGGISTFMSSIYRAMASGSTPNFSLASAQSFIYLLLIGGLLAWYVWSTRREDRFALVSPQGGGDGRVDLGRWRYLLSAVLLAYWFAAFGMLLLVAFLSSVAPYYTVTEGNPFHDLTLANYRLAMDGDVIEAISGSLILAIAVAFLTVCCALILAVVSLRTRWRGRRLADVAGTLPIAVPPLVFSVALLITMLSVPFLRNLYNSWTPMIVASVVAFLPFALRVVSSGLIAIPSSMTEASLACGAGAGRTLRLVTLPMLRPALVGAMLLVFVYSLRELAAVALLVRPGLNLLPTQIFGYLQTGEFGMANTLNVISVALPALVFAVYLLVQKTAGAVNRRLILARTPGLPPLGISALQDAARRLPG